MTLLAPYIAAEAIPALVAGERAETSIVGLAARIGTHAPPGRQ